MGLRDNHVLALLTDRQGGLWAGLQHGLSRIVVSPQFSVFDEAPASSASGARSSSTAACSTRAATKGCTPPRSRLRPRAPPRPRRELRFEKIAAIGPPVWAFVVVDGRLLVAAADGIHEVHGTTTRRVMRYPSSPVTLYRSRRDPARVYVGLEAGLASMRLERGIWQDEGRVDGIAETITSIGEGDDGDLWVVSQRQRVLRVSRDGAWPPRAHAYPLGEAPLTGRIAIREVARRSVFLAEDGIYEFDARANRFVPFASVEALVGKDRRSFAWIVEDAQGNLWVDVAQARARSISCASNRTGATCSKTRACADAGLVDLSGIAAATWSGSARPTPCSATTAPRRGVRPWPSPLSFAA